MIGSNVWHKPTSSYVRVIDWDPKDDTYECAKLVYTEEEVELEMF